VELAVVLDQLPDFLAPPAFLTLGYDHETLERGRIRFR